MKKTLPLLLALLMMVTWTLAACAKEGGLDPKNPVTLTMWHNYGGQMQETMDLLVDEFNITLGREAGIIISVTSVASQKEQAENLAMIVTGDPGAPALPDLTTCYPATAMTLLEEGLIIPLDGLFSPEELEAYQPQFLEEGRLSDGKLYVFPMAKSSEVLFVNKTLFHRFSQATGITLESLSTFEGIERAAVDYFAWTDEQTPDILNDGKTFFTADSWLNLALVGTAQLGEEFALPQGLQTSSAAYERVGAFCAAPAIQGGVAIYDGYSSDLAKTGEIVCSIGSTAGILFYGDTVTYPDNTTEPVSFTVLPYPVFEGGEKIALQRGGGFCVSKSDPQKEYAAGVFLKWLTAPAQNMRFVSSTGYLPVTKAAFEESMSREIEAVENENVKVLLQAAMEMYREYTFLTAPSFEGYDAMGKDYEREWKDAMKALQEAYLAGESFDTEQLPAFIKQLPVVQAVGTERAQEEAAP